MTKKQLTKKSASNKPSKKSGKEKKFQIASGLDLDALTDEELEKASGGSVEQAHACKNSRNPTFYCSKS